MDGDLISRKAMLEEIDERERIVRKLTAYMDDEAEMAVSLSALRKFVNNRPAVDAKPVVRCKNCLYSVLLKDTDFRNEPPWCFFIDNCRVCCCNALIEDEPIRVEDDFFCAYGTREGC